MLLILALILALIFLSWPWNLAVILVAVALEASIVALGLWYARRRRARVGVETLIGADASVVTALTPDGQAKVNGEIWRAHSEREVLAGETVRIRAVRGLTLEVDPPD